MKLKNLFLSCLVLLFFQTYVNAQSVYNNGVTIKITKGALVFVNGAVQNQTGQIDVDNVSGNSQLIIQDDFINNSVAGGSGYYRVLGDWINNNTFNAGTGTVFLEGANQSISGTNSTTFYNLTLNGTGKKTQTIHQYCSNVLNLNNVELQTQTFGFFVQNTAVASILYGTGFVSSLNGGFLSRKTNTANTYIFPVGSSLGTTRYRPVELTPANVTANTYTVRMANIDATTETFDRNLTESNICKVNPFYYHQINRTNGTAAVNMSIYYDNTADGGWDGITNWTTGPNQWKIIPGSSITVGAPLYKATAMAWNSFSQIPYALYVTTPTIIIGANTPICENGAINLTETGGDAVSWNWTGPDGFTSTDQNPTISPATFAANGFYYLTITDSFGCLNNDNVFIKIDAAANATINPVADLCISDAVVTLTAANIGGTWSGTGVSGSTFDPAIAGAGDHVIQYDISNGTCSDTDTETIHVDSDVNATITAVADMCESASSVTLTAVSSGGTWSGPGVTGNTFNPATAGPGDHTIQYNIINGACSDSDTEAVHIDGDVNATITLIGPFCETAGATALIGATSGGVWSGTGVSGNNFNPGIANIGGNLITYSVVNGLCNDTDTETIFVDSQVDATITTPFGPFCESETAQALGAAMIGGVWSGTGVVGTNFNPGVAGDGTHNIIYNIINGACSDSDNINVIVNANPTVPVASVDCSGGENNGIITVTSPIGADYEYSIGAAFQPSPIFGPLVNNTYVVTVENITSGCTSSGGNINIDCGCLNPTTLGLSSSSGSTCGILTKTIGANNFGGSATQVNLSHNGSGTLDQTTINVSPFSFTYTPSPLDAGHIVTISLTTNNPDGLPCTTSNTNYLLTVYTIPNVTVGNSTPVCNGGSLTLTETGGNATSWVWTGPTAFSSADHNPVLTSVSSANNGTYNVVVTDSHSCTNSGNVVILVNPNPAITIGGNSPICAGSDINLTETGGDAISWTWQGPNSYSSNDNNPIIIAALPAADGFYNLTVTDVNGCTSSSNIDIQVDTDVDATITTTGSFCENGSVVALNAATAGGTWSGTGVTGSNFDPSIGFGDYIITYSITIGACSNSDTETLHVDSEVFATITPVAPMCLTESPVTLSAITSGGTWAGDGISGSDFNPSLAGAGIHNITYNVIIGACSDSDDIDINVNGNPSAPTVAIDCSGGEDLGIINITSPLGLEYEYSIDGSFQASLSFGPLANGNYTVTVQDINTGCTLAGSVLNLNCGCLNAPTLNLASASDNVCANEGITITGNLFGGSATLVTLSHNGNGTLAETTINSSPFEFSYNPTLADQGATVTITITTNNPDGTPCMAAQQTFALTVLGIPSVIIGHNAPICEGETLIFTENGGDATDWSWTGPDSFNSDIQNPHIISASVDASGTYFITVTDINNCINIGNVDVVINPIPIQPITSFDCTGGLDNGIITITSPVGANYEYSIDGITFQAGTSFGSLSNGSYTITVNNTTTGCSTSGSLINLNCSCSDPTTLILSATTGNICPENSITISGNTFGGSASNVTISHDGTGILNETSIVTSPFSITYTPGAGDTGNDVIITVTTNNPAGDPCTATTQTFTLSVYTSPTISASANSPICVGQNLNFTENGGDAIAWQWTGPNSFASIENNPVILSANAVATGNYTIVITDAHGCIASSNVGVLVTSNATPQINEPGVICSDFSEIQFEATILGGIWSGNGIDPITGIFDPQETGTGVFEITYTIPGDCGGSDVIEFTVYQREDAGINPVDTLFLSDPAVIIIPNVPNGVWAGIGVNTITGEFTPSIANIGEHEVFYTVDGVCPASDSIIIVVIPDIIPDLLITDILTPNNDGFNDTWKIRGIQAFEKVEIVIFNRWGDEVFQFNGTGEAYYEVANQWDGMRNGKELPFGTYVYILILNNEHDYKGTVTIIR